MLTVLKRRNDHEWRIVDFEKQLLWYGSNLESTDVGIIGDFTDIREDVQSARTGKIMEVPVGENLIGRHCGPWSSS